VPKKYREETDCLNCGAKVTGRFCPECGQENVDSHENLFHLLGHYTADFFHFESKVPRSVIPLLTKPGFLTKEYWEGRRIIDHLVYTLHLQSFGYAVVAVAMLIPFLSRHSIPIVQLGTVLLLLVYMAQSLRYLYGQSWPKTILKSMVATSLLLFLTLVTMALYSGIPVLPVLPRVVHELETSRTK
jgi:hypothetical protein